MRDNAETIRTGLDAVKEHILIGGVLAALVVLLFLGNARSTIIAAVSIPISLVSQRPPASHAGRCAARARALSPCR